MGRKVMPLSIFNFQMCIRDRYEAAPDLNKFATKGSEFEKVVITKNPLVHAKLASVDVTANQVVLNMEGFRFEPADRHRVSTGVLTAPQNFRITEENREAYTLKPTWDKLANADFYEIEFNGMLYTTIRDTELLFEDLEADTPYSFKLRAVKMCIRDRLIRTLITL